jgi:hypothetical protein
MEGIGVKQNMTYTNGKIYRLTIPDGTLNYYGSTTRDLRKVLSDFKSNYNRSISGKSKSNMIAFQLFETGTSIDIVLVEKFPCECKEELHAREKYYIENNDCLNKDKFESKAISNDIMICLGCGKEYPRRLKKQHKSSLFHIFISDPIGKEVYLYRDGESAIVGAEGEFFIVETEFDGGDIKTEKKKKKHHIIDNRSFHKH